MGEAEAAAVAVYRLRSMLKGFGTDRSFWKLKTSAGCLKVPDVSLPKVVDTAQYRSYAQATWSSEMRGSYSFDHVGLMMNRLPPWNVCWDMF